MMIGAAGSSLLCTTSRPKKSSTVSPSPHPLSLERRSPARTRARRPRSISSNKEPDMLDTVITGGLAVLPSGAEPADIGISGETIAAIGAPGTLASGGAGRVVDATGQIDRPVTRLVSRPEHRRGHYA